MMDLEPRFEKRTGRSGAAIEQFERATPQNDGLRLIRTVSRLVDDANGNLIARQLAGHGQTYRSCAGD